jgi:hypothetical protein
LGLGFSFGIKGSIKAHNSSLTKGLVIPLFYRFC